MKKSLIAMAVVLLLCGCGRKEDVVEGSTKEAAASRKPGEVVLPADSAKLQQIRVARVESGAVPTDQVVVPGRIEVNPNRVSHVALPVSGRVSNVTVRIGEMALPVALTRPASTARPATASVRRAARAA